MKPICPVDECGKFTAPVDDFKGLYVKDADKLICKVLKVRLKRVLNVIRPDEAASDVCLMVCKLSIFGTTPFRRRVI